MIRRLFSGWFNPMTVSPLEGFFMRLLFALALIFTIRMPVQFTTEPHPVGLLRLLHKIDDHRTWLTWLADDTNYEIFRWSFIALMVPYVAGLALPIVLPVASLMHILPFTLFNSQGYTYHGAAMISTVLLTQALTVLYHSWRVGFTLAPPDEKLRGWMLLQSMVIVTGAYFISVIAKMEYSHGMWFWNSNNVALDMIKTARQTFYNHHPGPAPDLSPDDLAMLHGMGLLDVVFRTGSYPIHVVATWMLQHPWTARIMFGSGVVLEVVCILGIGHRALACFFGICLICFHRTIDVLMGGVQFPYNELCDFIFLVGLPFALAWVFLRIKNPVVRQATLVGAALGMVASYWIHPWTGRAGSSLPAYFLAMLNTIYGVWSGHDWAGFFEDTLPVFGMALGGGILGALAGRILSSRRVTPAVAA